MAAKRKEKRRLLPEAWSRPWGSADTPITRRWLWGVTRGVFVLGLLAVAVLGLSRLEEDVRGAAHQVAPARIHLVDSPPDLEAVMTAALAPFARAPWSDPALCADIAAAVQSTGWVGEVVSVHRFPDRRVEVRCRYRRPVAMVQAERGFYLIDEEGVRLPGCYANDPSLRLIQGVAAPVPQPGEVWPGEDVRAGLAVARLLDREPFAEQISAVLVQNYGGRLDPGGAHIQLATDRAGGRIVWGSAPGDEIEENAVETKLRLLRSNYGRFGRVDANRAVIDISVHPDRIITPT